MTSLMFGQLFTGGVPADEKVVRSTATPYDISAPAAMQKDQPEMGEVETDGNPNLGMVNRQLASVWIDREKSRPNWIEEVDNQSQFNNIIDRQVSNSGTAAAREAAGIWGHGTIPAAIGIEPVGDLRDGGHMGNEYFVRQDRHIQETASKDMLNPTLDFDRSTVGRVAGLGKQNARDAAMTAMYNTFWNGGQ